MAKRFFEQVQRQANGLPKFDPAIGTKKTFTITNESPHPEETSTIQVLPEAEENIVNLRVTHSLELHSGEIKCRSGIFPLSLGQAQDFYQAIKDEQNIQFSFSYYQTIGLSFKEEELVLNWTYRGETSLGESFFLNDSVDFKHCRSFLLLALENAINFIRESKE